MVDTAVNSGRRTVAKVPKKIMGFRRPPTGLWLHFFLFGASIAGLVVFLYSQFKNGAVNELIVADSAVYVLASLMFVLLLGSGLLKYLKDPTDENLQLDRNVDVEIANLHTSVSDLRDQMLQLRGEAVGLPDEAKERLLSAVMDRAIAGIDAAVSDVVKKKYLEIHGKLGLEGKIEGHFQKISIRLQRAIASLQRRANLNLVIGIIATVIGIYILSDTVFRYYSTIPAVTMTQDGVPGTDWTPRPDFLTEMAPRLALGAFIQIFAYFFLRLYSASNHDIKYYENEITNIEMKSIATTLALQSVDAKILVKALVDSERNFILRKGESTVALEAAKLEPRLAELLRQASKEDGKSP
jgi:hypothetical protein